MTQHTAPVAPTTVSHLTFLVYWYCDYETPELAVRATEQEAVALATEWSGLASRTEGSVQVSMIESLGESRTITSVAFPRPEAV